MTRERILNTIGIGLLAFCFFIALFRVFTREIEQRDPDRIVISFAHWQLESGIREAFDAIAQNYMEKFPHVTIRQIPIPERVYPTWLTVQLVGQQAPDLIQLGVGKGLTEDRLARYFVPLTEFVQHPNPFNEGTNLEGIPWQETFIDGLQSELTLNDQLLEVYGIPNALFTIRVFYNRDLWERILGDRPPPETLEEFIEVCEEVRAFSQRTGEDVFPIAGSRYNGPLLMNNLFTSQTQRLILEANPAHDLRPNSNFVLLEILRGNKSVGDTPFREGFALQSLITRHMQPGFQQLQREDASFRFERGGMLMIVSGSWDASSMHAEAPFPLGAFPIPFPSRDDPEFGQNVLGPVSERGIGTGAVFGVYRGTSNLDQTIHFLQYLTSKASAELFGEISGWLPAVEGVSVPEITKPFIPRLEGYPGGMGLGGPTERARVIEINQHHLAAGNVDRFVSELDSVFPQAIERDLSRISRNQLANVMRMDCSFGGYEHLYRQMPEGRLRDHLFNKMLEISETQVIQETNAYFLAHELEMIGN